MGSVAIEHESLSPDGPRRSPLVELLLLAAPTVAQMASYTLMQFLDTWMLAGVGEDEPTAAGNAGMFAFSVISLGMGVMFIVNTLVSQSFGRRDYVGCGRYLWQGVWAGLAFGLLVLPVLPFARLMFDQMGHSPRISQLEATYFQIAVAASALKLVQTAVGQFLLATNRPGSVLLATICGVSANAVAAWLMIFGHLGEGLSGVVGAAWAQNVGVCVELAVGVLLAMRPSKGISFDLHDWRPRAKELATLFRVGIPSGFHVVVDVLAWSLFMAVVIGQFGASAMAANVFMFRYMVLSFMPAFGIGQAVTALVGRYIGAGDPDAATHRARLGFGVATVYMTICGLLFFVLRYRLIGVFSDDPAVLATGATLLIFAAIYQLFDAMYVVYVSALRGAGDTLVPALVTGTTCWTVVVGGGYLVGRHFPQWGVTGPWVLATAYGAFAGLFMLTRFHRGGWRRIHLEGDASKGPDVSTRLSAVRGALPVVEPGR